MVQLASQEQSIFYRPEQIPDDGHCPVRACLKPLPEYVIPTSRQSYTNKYSDISTQHVHMFECRKREAQQDLQESAVYCYLCFTFFPQSQWNGHCQHHLDTLNMDCGLHLIRSNRHKLLLRPGFCPFCLGDQALKASDRWRNWMTSGALAGHVRQHLEAGGMLNGPCPHPCCHNATISDLASHLRCHHAIAGMGKFERPASNLATKKRKIEEAISPGSSNMKAGSDSKTSVDFISSDDDHLPALEEIFDLSTVSPAFSSHGKEHIDVKEFKNVFRAHDEDLSSLEGELVDFDTSMFLRKTPKLSPTIGASPVCHSDLKVENNSRTSPCEVEFLYSLPCANQKTADPGPFPDIVWENISIRVAHRVPWLKTCLETQDVPPFRNWYTGLLSRQERCLKLGGTRLLADKPRAGYYGPKGLGLM